MKAAIAVLSKDGHNVFEKVVEVMKLFDIGQPMYFGLVSPKDSFLEKNFAILNNKCIDWSVLAGFASTLSKTDSGYELLQLDDASMLFAGKVYSSVPKKSVTDWLSSDPQHCERLLHDMIQQADGDYSFILVKKGMMLAGRDPLGVQPLYYGENKEIAAFATNRKALWLLGIKTPLSFPPGNLGFADQQGFKFNPVKTLTYSLSQPLSIDEAALKLQVFLEESIKRRVRGLEKVAIAFSGGLDSSLISFLANKLGAKVTLIHVSMENKPEIEEAIAAADALNLPMQVDLFKESDVEKTVPKVVKLIEEPNSVKTSIGVPFYWISEKASEEGFKVVLAGQGADELFGGYKRYVNEYCQNGNEKAQKTMFNDVLNIYESNLERDKKIFSHFDIDLRLPFAMFELVDFALRLPLDCKMEQKPDTLRKLVLRKLALNVGLPKSIADKPKKAVQYSTGINDAIKRIARKHKKPVNNYLSELFQQSKNDI